ncbi:FAD-binding protein [Vallicoccus soli]|uniref:FAD-binding protein n=1 Tax=Vallicoccus soli TaxID=2339232 RepID=A0A3A3YSM3_9ACTN|nr:FAD-binding protein [Vallicoccus soli]
MTNWAGNVAFGARRLHRPASLEELRDVVATASSAGEPVRVLGTGHSFNRVADTDGHLVSVADLPREVDVDRAAGSVRVSGGTRYGELGAHLQAAGLALHNLGSLPHISVAGACATGTHGSGVRNRNLPSAVRAVELVTAGGEVVVRRRGEPGFEGAVLALGALGVVTALELDVQPSYDVRQVVHDDLPLAALEEDLDGVMGAAYSVSLFTDWQDRDGRGPLLQAWLKARDGEELPGAAWRGSRRADGPRHPVPGVATDPATEQGAVPGPWNARLPHFRLEFVPSNGEELQSEWFVERGHGIEALRALLPLADRLAPVLMISELRTVAADDLWLSPSYERDCLALHFTWHLDTPAVLPVVAAVEEALAPFAARPHWGKVFTAGGPEVGALYPRLDDARRLAAELDPRGTFRNELVDRYVPRWAAATAPA